MIVPAATGQRAPRSIYLTDTQQANVERYLEAVDLDDPAPAVDELAVEEDNEPIARIVVVVPNRGRNAEGRSGRTEYEIHRAGPRVPQYAAPVVSGGARPTVIGRTVDDSDDSDDDDDDIW